MVGLVLVENPAPVCRITSDVFPTPVAPISTTFAPHTLHHYHLPHPSTSFLAQPTRPGGCDRGNAGFGNSNQSTTTMRFSKEIPKVHPSSGGCLRPGGKGEGTDTGRDGEGAKLLVSGVQCSPSRADERGMWISLSHPTTRLHT